jgi:hypothetical protein
LKADDVTKANGVVEIFGCAEPADPAPLHVFVEVAHGERLLLFDDHVDHCSGRGESGEDRKRKKEGKVC